MGPPSDEGGNLGITVERQMYVRLQWGRPPMRAETTHAFLTTAMAGAKLQWGRPPMRAETSPSESMPSQSAPSFNGAALR